MRAFVTGQVGVDKGPYLEAVKEQARKNGIDLEVCHVGRMMYQEAPDVPKGRILNLPITRLNTLRRAVFKEILRAAGELSHPDGRAMSRHDVPLVRHAKPLEHRHGMLHRLPIGRRSHHDRDKRFRRFGHVETGDVIRPPRRF